MAMVPDDLLKKLHDANEKLRAGREKLARLAEMDFAGRDQLAGELRAAEAEAEEVARAIDPIVHADPTSPPPPPQSPVHALTPPPEQGRSE